MLTDGRQRGYPNYTDVVANVDTDTAEREPPARVDASGRRRRWSWLVPRGIVSSGWRNRHLVLQLARREVEARYRGSLLGIVWAFVLPVFLLAVYTFVFSVVFEARWNVGTGDRGNFALLVFSGMVFFGIFGETVGRAPGLVLENVSYVKRVVFPLEILPLVAVTVALVNAAFAGVILAIFYAVAVGAPPVTALLLPIVLAPLVILSLGLTWLVSALGVFLRDLRQLITVAVTALYFLSPIFYPLDALPEAARRWLLLNPIALVLESSKEVLFFGNVPHWGSLGLATLVSTATAVLGYQSFQRLKGGFADVV